ncbi:MAG: porin family protein [Lachnospiraceae bacterium]|nr:porin family protein [Lachnospiraceae bacterium]
MAVGLNLGVAPCLESGASVTNFGIGAKFQYNVTNPIRLEANVDYWFKNKGVDVFDVTANVHYLFNIGTKMKVYPLVGIGYAHVSGGISSNVEDWIDHIYDEYYGGNYGVVDDDDDVPTVDSSSASKFLFNVGAGFQYDLSDKLALGAEIKYQYIKDFSRLPISVGVTYKF